MRAAVYYGNRDVRVTSVPDPGGPGPGGVLLRVRRASLCGTDVSEYLHGPILIPVDQPHPVAQEREPSGICNPNTSRRGSEQNPKPLPQSGGGV